MEATMFCLASFLYIILSGGFTTVELKRKAVECFRSFPLSPKSGGGKISIDRAEMLMFRPSKSLKVDDSFPIWHARARSVGLECAGSDPVGLSKQKCRKQNSQAKRQAVLQEVVELAAPCAQTQAPANVAALGRAQAQTIKPTLGREASPTSTASTEFFEFPMAEGPFNPPAFRRELSSTLKELAMDRNTAAAVRRIRSQQVPAEHQANEFADLLTRAAEENRGPVRFSFVAFAAGLTASGRGPWAREECLRGISMFFEEIYADLCDDVPKLPRIVSLEFLPTLYSVLPSEDLDPIVPETLRQLRGHV